MAGGEPRPNVLSSLVNGVLEFVSLMGTVLSFLCCYVSIADLSPRSALAAGLGMWLLTSACLLTLCLRGRLDGRLLLLWGVPSAAVRAELLRRGPLVFFGHRW